MIAALHATTSEPWPLRPGDVHVWRFACDQELDGLVDLLPEDERRAAQRFAAAEHRAHYLVQRVMMRGLLARYVAIGPWQLRFSRAPRGKPAVVGGGDLELNLSHAEDVALLAVARGFGVGVDIERLDANLDPSALGPIVAAPDEVAPCADRHGFLRIWCRKEACLKATGLGILDDLTSVSVVADQLDVRGSVVYVQDLFVSPLHAAALATTVPVANVSSTALESYRVTS